MSVSSCAVLVSCGGTRLGLGGHSKAFEKNFHMYDRPGDITPEATGVS